MVRSNADEYYRYEFAIQGGGATLPNPRSSTTSISTTETRTPFAPASGSTVRGTPPSRRTASARRPPHDPGPGDRRSEQLGPLAADGIRPAAIDVQGAVIPDTGHWLAEQAPEEMLELLTEFLAPYLAGA